jgi:hypothetical protein
MGIYKNDVNPLNVLGMRRLNRIPPNFTKFQIKTFVDIRELDKWIYLNLNSRYCVKKSTAVVDNKLTTIIEVGIEDPKEISMMTLACPHLN